MCRACPGRARLSSTGGHAFRDTFPNENLKIPASQEHAIEAVNVCRRTAKTACLSAPRMCSIVRMRAAYEERHKPTRQEWGCFLPLCHVFA